MAAKDEQQAPDFLSVRQAAVEAGWVPADIYNLIARGDLPAQKIGNLTVIAKSAWKKFRKGEGK